MEFKKSLDELREEFYKKIKNEGGSIDEIRTVIREMQQKYEVESVEWNVLQEIYESELGADQKERGIDAMKGIREALEKIFQRKPEISAENFNEHYGETHVVVTSHSPGAVLAQSNVDMPKDPLQPHVIQIDMSGNKKVVPTTKQDGIKTQDTIEGSEPPADVPPPNPEPTQGSEEESQSIPRASAGDLARNVYLGSASRIEVAENAHRRYLQTLFSFDHLGARLDSQFFHPLPQLIAIYKQVRHLMSLPVSHELYIGPVREVNTFMFGLHQAILERIQQELQQNEDERGAVLHLLQHTFNLDADNMEEGELRWRVHQCLLMKISADESARAEAIAKVALENTKKKLEEERKNQEQQAERARNIAEQARQQEEERQRQEAAAAQASAEANRKSDEKEKAKRKTEQPWSAPLPTMKSTEYVNELLRKYPEESSMYGRAIRRLLRMRGWKGEDPGASSSQISRSETPSTIPMPQIKQPAGPQEKPKDANSKTSVESKKQSA